MGPLDFSKPPKPFSDVYLTNIHGFHYNFVKYLIERYHYYETGQRIVHSEESPDFGCCIEIGCEHDKHVYSKLVGTGYISMFYPNGRSE